MSIAEKLSKEFTGITIKQYPDGSVDFIREYDAPAGSVFVNGQQAQVDQNGNYTATVNTNTANVQIKLKNGTLLTSAQTLVTGNNKVNVTKTVSFQDVMNNMKKMDSSSTTSSPLSTQGSVSNPVVSPNAIIPPGGGGGPFPGQNDGDYLYNGEAVHCDRMNGPNSDNRYWSEYRPMAWNDFVGSDCDHEAISYGCSSWGSGMRACDGLDVYGNGVHDCSSAGGWSEFYWKRN